MHSMGKLLKIAVLIAVAVFCTPAPVVANATIFPGYSVSIYPPNSKLFVQWNRMLARQDHRSLETENCSPGFFKTCFEPELKAQITKARKSNKGEQVKAINQWVNYLRYVTDPLNYDKQDYWATKHEFLGVKESGDCEDYAITKYFALKKLGFQEDDLWILVARDENLGINHAVLLVRMQNREVILDNRVKSIVTNPLSVGLKPIYAVNEKGWMRYRPKLRSRK